MSDTEPKATRDGFGEGLLVLGEKMNQVVVLDADLAESTRGYKFMKKFPNRHFQIGISEQDMMGTAAGFASCGKIAFAATFACFSERGFEQFRTTIARQKLNVKLIGSHAGLQTGEDGSSAQALEDMALYRSLANVIVISPSDAEEAKQATIALSDHNGPAYLRLGRAKYPPITHIAPFKIGVIETLRLGMDVVLIATGAMVHEALAATKMLEEQKISAYVLNCATIKPFDSATLLKAVKKAGCVVSCEDHNVIGGLGSAVAEILSEEYPSPLVRVGVHDSFGESGTPAQLYDKYGLSAKHIVSAAKKAIKMKNDNQSKR